MKADLQPLRIDAHASAAQLGDAAQRLQRAEGTVILESLIVLHATPTALRCQVIDNDALAHRCAEEFKVLIENAQRHLAASTLAAHLPPQHQAWEVVRSNGAAYVRLWPDT